MAIPRIAVTSAPGTPDGHRTEVCPRAVVDAVVAAGGLPVILPTLAPGLVGAVLDGVDGVVVTGGGDVRLRGPGLAVAEGAAADRDAFELPLVGGALAAGLPVLGLGRGHQVLNVALGGTLVAHLPAGDGGAERLEQAEPSVHEVRIAQGSLLAALVGGTTLGVNSRHHRAVELAGAGLQVVARSVDGHVEAVEGVGDVRAVGVQWQPELLADRPAHAALFRWLVGEAAVHPDTRGGDPSRADEVGPTAPPVAVGAGFV